MLEQATRFFRDEVSRHGSGANNADRDELTALGARHGQYCKLENVHELDEHFGLRFGDPLSGGWAPRASLPD